MGIFCHIAEIENISATVMNICSKLINVPIYSQRRKKNLHIKTRFKIKYLIKR
jgi:hypothetical protein